MTSRLSAFHLSLFKRHLDSRVLAQSPEMQFLLPFLQSKWLRFLVFFVVLGTFVPVTITAVACQIHCALQGKIDLGSFHKNSHDSEISTLHGALASNLDQTKVSSFHHVSDHLQHPGACHLAHVPGLDEALTELGILKTKSGWMNQVMVHPTSCTWPPPRHPPRA